MTTLKDCGMEDLGIGDSFEMTYTDHNGSHTKNFTISGIWDGYGDRQVFFVSRKFFENSGYTLDQTRSGIMYLNFDAEYLSEEERQDILAQLNLGEQQYFEFSQEMSSRMEVMAGAAGLVLAICLSAYLLIYNILSLSVSANIRYYGLLETIGMTGSQIRKFLRRQMALLGAAGIAAGMGFGVIVSFRLIPFIVTFLGIHQDDIHVIFHPAVFMLAVGIAAATIFLGNRNAVKTAGSVSPVDALCYCGLSGNRNEYKEHPERFDSFCYGISRREFDYLKENEDIKTEWKDFKEGKTCLLYNGAMNLPEKTFTGKTLTFWEDQKGASERKITIGDLVSEEYYGAGPGKGLVILVSQDYMKEISGSLVFRMSVSYKEPYDQETEQKVLRKIQEAPGQKDFSYTSKIEDLKEARRAQGNMMGVGIGLTVIIAWIGVMNYINTVSGNISSRQTDLAILEGIGMTRRQMKGMLMREGILYGLVSWLITATAGLGVTYVIYQKMNSNQIPFEVPPAWILGMAGIILILCALVPLVFYHIIDKRKSIIERIREIQ